MSGREGKSREDGNLRSQIIPLSMVKDKWLLGRRAIAEEKAEGPEYAFRAMLVAMKNLYYMKGERWRKLRDRVKLGLIKETVSFGNTSVSMGAAKSVPAFEDMVGFLNCGTGGIKYQMYSARELLHVVAEFKPKNGCSPNALQVGGYKPKKGAVFGVEAARELLLKELAEAPWRHLPSTPVYAFVTGTLRQHWEDSGEEERALLDKEMCRLFEHTGVQPLPLAPSSHASSPSFFMSQDDEGRLELIGTRTMYANLVTAQQLDPGSNVVVSLGIGRGSCQWMVLKTTGEPELIAHKFGMTDTNNLGLLSATLTNAYSDPEVWGRFLDVMESTENPVIALKSGAMLLLESNAGLKELFRSPLPLPPPLSVQVVRNGSQGPPLSYTWAGSLDELCAEASELLGVRVDFETVYRQSGAVVTSRAELKNQELLVLAPLGEAFVKPTVSTPNPAIAAMQFKMTRDYTMTRKQFQSELNRTANDELVRWIGEALGRPLDPKLTTALNDGGLTVCELVSKAGPIKYNTKALRGSFKARENVNCYFAKACRNLGIRSEDICTADQIANEDLSPVIACMLRLVGALLNTVAGLPPPSETLLQHLKQ